MIFAVVGTALKQELPAPRVKAINFVITNAKSEREAVGAFLDSAEVTQHAKDGWWLGQPTVLQLDPNVLLQDEDLAHFIVARRRVKQEAPLMAQVATSENGTNTTE